MIFAIAWSWSRRGSCSASVGKNPAFFERLLALGVVERRYQLRVCEHYEETGFLGTQAKIHLLKDRRDLSDNRHGCEWYPCQSLLGVGEGCDRRPRNPKCPRGLVETERFGVASNFSRSSPQLSPPRCRTDHRAASSVTSRWRIPIVSSAAIASALRAAMAAPANSANAARRDRSGFGAERQQLVVNVFGCRRRRRHQQGDERHRLRFSHSTTQQAKARASTSPRGQGHRCCPHAPPNAIQSSPDQPAFAGRSSVITPTL